MYNVTASSTKSSKFTHVLALFHCCGNFDEVLGVCVRLVPDKEFEGGEITSLRESRLKRTEKLYLLLAGENVDFAGTKDTECVD